MSAFNDPQLQPAGQFVDWELLRLFFAREEAAQFSIQRLQHHNEQYTRLLREATVSNQQCQSLISHLQIELDRWKAIQQESAAKEDAIAAQLNEERQLHMADRAMLHKEIERRRNIELQLESSKKQVGMLQSTLQAAISEKKCKLG